MVKGLRLTSYNWDREGVQHAVRAALAADLPRQVTITKVERIEHVFPHRMEWRIQFIMPHMQTAMTLEVEQPNQTPFPYDEVLTKIRLFLP